MWLALWTYSQVSCCNTVTRLYLMLTTNVVSCTPSPGPLPALTKTQTGWFSTSGWLLKEHSCLLSWKRMKPFMIIIWILLKDRLTGNYALLKYGILLKRTSSSPNSWCLPVTLSKQRYWSTVFSTNPNRSRTPCVSSQYCWLEAVEPPRPVQSSCIPRNLPRRTSCSRESTFLLPPNLPLIKPTSKWNVTSKWAKTSPLLTISCWMYSLMTWVCQKWTIGVTRKPWKL